MDENLKKLADERRKFHSGQVSQTPEFSKNAEYIGMKGEQWFGSLFNELPDFTLRPAGDDGYDFTINGYTIDVKTFRKPYNLLVEVGTVLADIYVLLAYFDETDSCKFLGWAWNWEVWNAPRKDWGYGKVNHYIPTETLGDNTSLKYLLGVE